MARNTSCEATADANAEWLEATGGLRLADVMAVHAAIHDRVSASVTLASTGHTFPIFVSPNGCRRCDLVVDPAQRPKGRCKLMEQNTGKDSGSAQRARTLGAKITHIIPLDDEGRHTPAKYSGDWGRIEEGKLTKNCAAVLHAEDVAAHTGRPSTTPKRRRPEDRPPRRFIECPFAEKNIAKSRGAKWDAAAKSWYVPEGLDMANFAEWDPAAPYSAPSAPARNKQPAAGGNCSSSSSSSSAAKANELDEEEEKEVEGEIKEYKGEEKNDDDDADDDDDARVVFGADEDGPHVWAGACARTEGCVLPALHRGKCKVGTFEEEDYEVEEILNERVESGKHAKKSGGALQWTTRNVEYFVKWKGWPVEDATWEPASALAGCPEVLTAWRSSSSSSQQQQQQQQQSPSVVVD